MNVADKYLFDSWKREKRDEEKVMNWIRCTYLPLHWIYLGKQEKNLEFFFSVIFITWAKPETDVGKMRVLRGEKMEKVQLNW